MKRSTRSLLVNTIVLAFVLAAVAVYYFIVLLPSSSDKRRAGILLMDDLRRNDIRALDITCGISTNLSHTALENRDNEWFLDAPVRDGADDEALNNLLNAVSAIEVDRVLSNFTSLAEYGIDKPEWTFRFAYRDGKELSLLDGGASSDGVYHYLFRNDRSNFVYLVKSGLMQPLYSAPEDYRSKTLWTLSLDELTAVEMTTPNGVFRFTNTGKKNGEFVQNYPRAAAVDNTAFRSILVDHLSLNIDRFTDSRDSLEKPLYRMRLFSGRTVEELRLGSPDKAMTDEYPVFIPSRKAFAVIKTDDLPAMFDLTAVTQGGGN